MPKQGEIDYLRNLGEEGTWHAANKPFSDDNCGTYLANLGVVMLFLPPPPARLLDLGCGTGWTSCMFARRGYQVTGQDICPDMIEQARLNQSKHQLDNLDFVVSDYEDMQWTGEFDCAVFFDALHHSTDERAALAMVHRALRPGGVCVTSEPGDGHENHPQTVEVVRKFNVTERDMPPRRIMAAASGAGFSACRAYPHPQTVLAAHYRSATAGWLRRLVRNVRLACDPNMGIVVLTK